MLLYLGARLFFLIEYIIIFCCCYCYFTSRALTFFFLRCQFVWLFNMLLITPTTETAVADWPFSFNALPGHRVLPRAATFILFGSLAVVWRGRCI